MHWGLMVTRVLYEGAGEQWPDISPGSVVSCSWALADLVSELAIRHHKEIKIELREGSVDEWEAKQIAWDCVATAGGDRGKQVHVLERYLDLVALHEGRRRAEAEKRKRQIKSAKRVPERNPAVRLPELDGVTWEEEPLGQVSDRQIAQRLGVNQSVVRRARMALGIGPANPQRARRIDWDSQPLGQVADYVLASRLGVCETTVATYRNARGIPSHRKMKGKVRR